MNNKTLLVIFLIITVFVSGYYLNSENKTSTITNNEISEEEKENTNTNLNPQEGSKIFKSDTLGITFYYIDKEIGVKQDGNKAIVYSLEYPDTNQYVEVHTKEPDDTLEEAIKKQFLNGYNPEECFVEPLEKPHALWSNNDNHQYAIITVPKEQNEEMESLTKKWLKCPTAPYTTTNGISYFFMDSNHPDKLLFFSIGQFPIGSSSNTEIKETWQETIKLFSN